MPIYEYQCLHCNEKHEIIQRYSETPLEHCPKCGGEMKKLISSPAIQFKGSGFYKTDYPSSSSSAGTSKAASDAKAESKSESKPETKSESKSESTTAAPAAAKSESKASD
jgi:putative FmdB family regulatory protein